jgi:hypothetical protein
LVDEQYNKFSVDYNNSNRKKNENFYTKQIEVKRKEDEVYRENKLIFNKHLICHDEKKENNIT